MYGTYAKVQHIRGNVSRICFGVRTVANHTSRSHLRFRLKTCQHGSPIPFGDSWVDGGPGLVNAVARMLSGGDSWFGGGPCLVNAVARRFNGGGSWVGGLVGVADVMKG